MKAQNSSKHGIGKDFPVIEFMVSKQNLFSSKYCKERREKRGKTSLRKYPIVQAWRNIWGFTPIYLRDHWFRTSANFTWFLTPHPFCRQLFTERSVNNQINFWSPQFFLKKGTKLTIMSIFFTQDSEFCSFFWKNRGHHKLFSKFTDL